MNNKKVKTFRKVKKSMSMANTTRLSKDANFSTIIDRYISTFIKSLNVVSGSKTTIFVSNCKISENSTRIKVIFFYYISNNSSIDTLTTNSDYKIDHNKIVLAISHILSTLFSKEVAVEIVRLDYAHINADIFSQFLIICTVNSTFNDFSNFIQKIILENGGYIPTSITGISITLRGRLTTETVQPRITTSRYIVGKINNTDYVESASTTCVNDLGLYTIKVTIGHTNNPYYF